MGLFWRNKFRTQFPSTSRNSSRKWHGIATPKESHGEIPRHSTDFCSFARQMNRCICREMTKNNGQHSLNCFYDCSFNICIYIHRIFFFLLYPLRIAFLNCGYKLCKPYLIWNKLVVVVIVDIHRNWNMDPRDWIGNDFTQKRTDGIKAMPRGFFANARTCSHISFIKNNRKWRTFFLLTIFKTQRHF